MVWHISFGVVTMHEAAAIAGIVYPETFQISPHNIDAMLDIMSYRNPEGKSIQNYPQAYFGTCGPFLAINEANTLAVMMDGHIYNDIELQKDLATLGIRVDPKIHTELVLHAYKAWGIDFIQRLNGNFAIAIYDADAETLWLIRDRLGKKPLYWYFEKELFIFGSELKALLTTDLIPQTLDEDSIATYLKMGFMPQDMTPIRKVSKLLPGHYLRYHIGHGESITSYWSYSTFFDREDKEEKETAIAKRLDGLLTSSVDRRMTGDPKIGCLISGGLGSACVASYVQKLCSPAQLTAFSLGFSGKSDPNFDTATQVAQELGLKHVTDQIGKDNFLDDLIRIVWHLDEPLADPMILATWKLAQLASKQVKTVFSGLGSDQLAGDPFHKTFKTGHSSLMQGISSFFRPLIHRLVVPILAGVYKNGAYRFLKFKHGKEWNTDYLMHHVLFDDKSLAKAAPKLVGLFDPDVMLHKFYETASKSSIPLFPYFDAKTRLVDSLILQYDRLTAAHSLDWKTPFLDRDIVEYLAGFIHSGLLAGRDMSDCVKYLLKPVFSNKILNQAYQQPPHFLKAWSQEPELNVLLQLVTQGCLVETGLISRKWLESQIASPPKVWNNIDQLWAILILEIWVRLYINRPLKKEISETTPFRLLSEI